MAYELLDYDPLTRTRQWFELGENGEYRIVTEQDVGPLMEANAEQLKAFDRTSWGQGAIHSRVPNIVLWELNRRGMMGDNFDADTPEMRTWINSSDNLWKVRKDRA